MKNFLKTCVLGGVAVMLPVAIIGGVFYWIFKIITDIIQPLSDQIVEQSHVREIAADGIVVLLIIAACFLIGMIIKTRVGKFIHLHLEERILKIAPGYSMIKETVKQFLFAEQTPFSSVAFARVFDGDALMTAFVTDTYDDGYTIFVPTGPNPTSGNIYHLHKDHVFVLDVAVDVAMRSIISCGTGSKLLMDDYKKKYGE